ncbi:MAG: prepilin peptidase [Planctomycetota bacterium]|nr:MAG: prepilin peptidase [Planctomycetota bacterium]
MDHWIVPLTDGLVAAFLVVLGANLGSFLNVVVYRLPRGESVVHGGSHCPACGASIRWFDNLPILGWFVLKGRCRDCRAPIAAGYPLVEAVSALLIGGLAGAQLLSGGRTLPGTVFASGRAGADALLLHPDWRLVAATALHVWVLFAILVAAAVEADGQRVPLRWRRIALLATLLAVMAWPAMQPVGPWPGSQAWLAVGWGRGLIVSVLGIAAGILLGARGSPAVRDGFILAGAALGWQAVVMLAGMTIICGGLRRLAQRMVVSPERPGKVEHSVTQDHQSFDPPVAPADGSTLGQRLAVPVADWLSAVGFTGGDLAVAFVLHQLTWQFSWRGVQGLLF